MPEQPIYNAAENRYTRNDSLSGQENVLRTRVTLAQLNAGLALLPAMVGYVYSLVGFKLIAVGGAVTGATAVVILGTRAAGSVTLVSALIAALTQSTVVSSGTANVTVLADGASFTPLDSGTGITVGVTGSPAATLTNLDVILEYTMLPG